jgi:hypothetical protein
MKDMVYKQKTRYLGIPVIGYGNRIIPEQELKKYQVIENMLLAGLGGVKSCVFDDGSYSLESESDGSFRVVLGATGSSPGAEGIAGGVYFHVESVRWDGLKAGSKHYLYLATSSKTYEDCSAVSAVSSVHPGVEGDGSLLMAVVDLQGAVGSVDADPDGKLYSSDLARHVGDSENPHGRVLRQDGVVVSESLSFEDEAVIKVGETFFQASLLPEAISVVSGRKLKKVDFDSSGPVGMVVKVNGAAEVWAVLSVHRRAAGKIPVGNLGEVSIGYHGEDGLADEANEFVVYNGGGAGLPLRAVVMCS